jgi:hypothetical protein
MSHEGGPEQPQRTVAELLAKYGAESGERAPRRRRRRADDMNDTGAQAIINRVMSESGEMPVIREDTPPPERTSHRRGPDTGFQRPVEPPRRRQAPPAPSAPQPSQQLQRPPQGMPPQPSQQLQRPQQPPQQAPQGPPPGGPVGPPSSSRLPAIARPSEPTTPVRGTPQPSQQLPRPPQPHQQRPQPSQRIPLPPGNRSGVQPSLRSRLDGAETAPPPPPPMPAQQAEPTTEELPRVQGRIPVDGSMTGRRPVPPPGQDSRTRITPVYPPPRAPYGDPPEEEYRSPYPEADPDDRYDSAEYDNLLDGEDLSRNRRAGRDDLDDLDDDLDDLDGLDDDDLDDDREPSPVREWLVMGGQLALGVLGGAAVWLGFNWLWGFLPQAALVVALAVTVGLVLIVRKIRRAEDLQTTVLAVLVGLVVTVSPAALLLLNR